VNLGELVAHVDVDIDDGLAKIRRFKGGFKDLGESITKSLAPLAIASSLPLLTGAAAASLELSGALGVVPAAAGAAALAIGTVKLATQGFGDAMKNIRDPKAFAEDIKTLSPAAQDTARALQGLIGPWDALQQRVQNTFFAGLNTHVAALGGTYIPILGTAMDRTAGSFNRGAKGVAEFLEKGSTVDDVSASFGNMNTFIDQLVGTAPALVAMIVDFVTVGSESLPSLSGYIVELINRFTEFISKARESGQLGEWIQGGLDALKIFGAVIFNIGGIVGAVFQAANQGGDSFLVMLYNLTEQMLAWAQSAEGQEKIGELFAMLEQVAFGILGILPMVAEVVFFLASAFASLPGPVQSVIGSLIGWSLLLGLIIPRLMPLISLLGMLRLSMITTAATSVATGAVWVASTVASAAVVIAQWVAMGAAAMARAVMMAAAWVIAMGPIGWIIAGIVALVALIIYNWDAIWAKTQEVWGAIWNFIKQAGEFIKNIVMAALKFILDLFLKYHPVGIVIQHWDAIVGAISSGVGRAIAFVTSLPGKITGALGDAGRWLIDAGKKIIQGLIDGILSMIGAAGRAIGAVARRIRDALPFSPAKWGPLSGPGSPDIAGRTLGAMLAAGIRRSLTEVSNATVQVASAAQTSTLGAPGLAAAGGVAGLDLRDVEAALQRAMTRAMDQARLLIDGTGAARLVNATNQLDSRRMGGFSGR